MANALPRQVVEDRDEMADALEVMDMVDTVDTTVDIKSVT